MAALLLDDDASEALAGQGSGEYVVVARRYRPQSFEQLIGQDHVAKGLRAAIEASRVGHAYLFTGARGTGKTSTARIFAKALNCEKGPTPTPCEECDACRAITAGADMDVLEIDGASNNGIDQIRELRQNANVRPSRSRFKIYIIDEVHMLSTAAFNGLLKTLEEPPEHVKFIFCTTNAEKIPITILSRCQRYDFAGIQTAQILGRLAEIVAAEGTEAEPEALAILARRAAGSMRDSQSLLEQLLAFGSRRITVADVHALLGTAGSDRIASLVRNLNARDAAAVLTDLDQAVAQGVDVGQLIEQLSGYYRDLMVTAVGAPPQLLLNVSQSEQADATKTASELGLGKILAILQLLDQTAGRLKYLTAPRTVVELALVRICQLEQLESLPELIAAIKEGRVGDAAGAPAGTSSATAAAKKKFDEPVTAMVAARPACLPPPTNGHGAIAAPQASFAATEEIAVNARSISLDLTPQAALALWQQAAEQLGGLTASNAQLASSAEMRPPNLLSVTFPGKYNSCKQFLERAEISSKISAVLESLTGTVIKLSLVVEESAAPAAVEPARAASRQQRMYQVTQRPFVRQALEVFDATAERFDDGGGS